MRTTPQPLTDERKIALSQVNSIYDVHQQAMLQRKEWGKTEAFPTNWRRFNDYIGGGFGKKTEGELIVIAGETGIGKSTLAANIAMHVAQNGNKVGYITLEDSVERTYNNLLFVAGLQDDPKGLFAFKDTIFTPTNALLQSDAGWTSDDLIQHMDFIGKARGIRFIVIDHLNFMFENEEELRDENLRVRVTMKKLSNFAIRENVTILAVSHMNKAQQTAKQQEPNLDRIYGSSGITQASTKTLLLWRPEVEQSSDQTIIEVKLAKSRHTKTQREWFQFDATEAQWREIGVRSL